MCNGNRFFLAEADGKIDRTNADDSKLASSELTLKAEIGIHGLIKAQVSYTRKKAKSGTDGDESNLAGGNYSNLAGGYESNLAGGYKSNLAGGESSFIIGRNGSRAKAGLHSVITLTEWGWRSDKYVPISVKAEIVDGDRIKADTWYTVKNGEFVEV